MQQENIASRPDAREETLSSATAIHQPANELAQLLPCVIYECNNALEISHVSSNVFELIGVWPKDLIGSRDHWEQRIPREDLKLVSERLVDLDTLGSTSAIHRIVRESGLPIWVAHSWRRVSAKGVEIIRGCIVPMENEKRVQGVDPGVISRFVHKLGNQFQLLNLVINSLRKELPDSRETEILQQAVEKSIELARAFSDFSQASTWMSIVDLAEILRAAYVTKRSSFIQKGVSLDERVTVSLGAASVYGDPFLLEVAVSNLLQNALEATDAGGTVELHAEVESLQNSCAVAKVCVIDSGCGIAESNLENVFTPFLTSKKDHEGLGLSMAARFIELHNGILKITSAEGKGTKVEIILPTVHSARHPDF
jgi:two-component sensor histidine kinase